MSKGNGNIMQWIGTRSIQVNDFGMMPVTGKTKLRLNFAVGKIKQIMIFCRITWKPFKEEMGFKTCDP